MTPQVNAGFVNVGNVSAGSMVTIAKVDGAPDELVDTVTFNAAQPNSTFTVSTDNNRPATGYQFMFNITNGYAANTPAINDVMISFRNTATGDVDFSGIGKFTPLPPGKSQGASGPTFGLQGNIKSNASYKVTARPHLYPSQTQ